MGHAKPATRTLPDVWKAGDDWTKITEKEERKRIQNRLNQRAYRRNHAKKDSAKSSFRIERFRVSDVPVRDSLGVENNTAENSTSLERDQTREDSNLGESQLLSILLLPEEQTVLQSPYVPANTDLLDGLFYHQKTYAPDSSTSNLSFLDWGQIPTSTLSPLAPYSSSSTYFPLSSDHLLKLIHLNVYRAITMLKVLLNSNAVVYKKLPAATILQRNLCDSYTIILPRTDKSLPIALQPTEAQMSISHSGWFNVFPYPNLRDNLIRHESDFDHVDLCNDLFGDLIGNNDLSFSRRHEDAILSSALGISTCDTGVEFDDEITARRNGLILWGEPWDPESWEATPGFLMKWSWLLGGCEDLIRSSNRWRAERFEEPVFISSHIDTPHIDIG